MVPRTHELAPNGIAIGLAVYAQLTRQWNVIPIKDDIVAENSPHRFFWVIINRFCF